MRKFLKNNNFVKVPKRGKDVKAVYSQPGKGIFLTIFKDGNWSVSKAGGGLDELEFWTMQISEYMQSRNRRR